MSNLHQAVKETVKGHIWMWRSFSLVTSAFHIHFLSTLKIKKKVLLVYFLFTKFKVVQEFFLPTVLCSIEQSFHLIESHLRFLLLLFLTFIKTRVTSPSNPPPPQSPLHTHTLSCFGLVLSPIIHLFSKWVSKFRPDGRNFASSVAVETRLTHRQMEWSASGSFERLKKPVRIYGLLYGCTDTQTFFHFGVKCIGEQKKSHKCRHCQGQRI